MKKFIFTASFLGLFLLVAGVAFGHGGNYDGPAGGGSGSFSPVGGATPGGGTTPGGGVTPGGTTPGGGANPGSTPGGGGTPGGAPGRPGGARPGGGGLGRGGGGATPGGRKKTSDSNVTWGAWWFFNDDKYLNLKAKIRATETETDNTDIFFGENSDGDVITRVPAKKIREGVIPVLKLGLKDSFFDTRAAAAIALGKCGNPDNAADIKELLKDENKQVRESTALALGILGNKEAIPDLVEIMNNTKKAKKMLARDGKDILTRTRAFAAFAIGLIGSRTDISDTQGVSALLGMISEEQKLRDLEVGPLVALGVMRSEEATQPLIEFVKNKKMHEQSRSYAVTSLGKIGNRAALPTLLKALRDKKNPVRQSATIALGILANPDDKDVAKALQRVNKSDADRAVRNFSIMALGEIGGKDNRNFLDRLLKNASNRFERTFAAMALGVYAQATDDLEIVVIGDKLHKAFRKEKNFEEKGAYAIAMSLMGVEKASEDLLKELEKGYGQASYRAHLCTALGLLNHKPAIKIVREVVKEKGDVNLRRAASIALGLLGDKDAVSVLEKEIARSENSQAVHGAVTQGLGFIGDVSAVPTLTEMVKDRKKFKDATRAFAAVALGLLGDKDNIPILSKIAENNNYLQRTEALAELLTIL